MENADSPLKDEQPRIQSLDYEKKSPPFKSEFSMKNYIENNIIYESLTPYESVKLPLTPLAKKSIQGNSTLKFLFDDQEQQQFLKDSFVTKMFKETQIQQDLLINSFELARNGANSQKLSTNSNANKQSLKLDLIQRQQKKQDREAKMKFQLREFASCESLPLESPQSLKQTAKINKLENTVRKEPEERIGCNCKKSKCLKLYCDCFMIEGYCSEKCKCSDCQNVKDSKQRQKAISQILNRNPDAFQSKIEVVGNILEEKRDNLLGVKSGCNCKKTFCRKKYCECYNAGVKCSYLCQCTQCRNSKDEGKQNQDLRNSFSFGEDEDGDNFAKKLIMMNGKFNQIPITPKYQLRQSNRKLQEQNQQ